jgi:hypothetical protein
VCVYVCVQYRGTTHSGGVFFFVVHTNAHTRGMAVSNLPEVPKP